MFWRNCIHLSLVGKLFVEQVKDLRWLMDLLLRPVASSGHQGQCPLIYWGLPPPSLHSISIHIPCQQGAMCFGKRSSKEAIWNDSSFACPLPEQRQVVWFPVGEEGVKRRGIWMPLRFLLPNQRWNNLSLFGKGIDKWGDIPERLFAHSLSKAHDTTAAGKEVFGGC